jgi:hypothetical protein
MSDDKLRKRIASEAARLVLNRQETDLKKARLKAARALVSGYVRRSAMPSDAEVRDLLAQQTYLTGEDVRFDNLRALRITALNFMRHLRRFEPRIQADLVTGTIRSGDEVKILLPKNSEEAAISYTSNDLQKQRQSTDKKAEVEIIHDPMPVPDNFIMRVSIEFRDEAWETAVPLSEFEQAVAQAYPDLQIIASDSAHSLPAHSPQEPDRFSIYRMLLAPLEQVHFRKSTHPESDALYHSLQVYALASQQIPYDEEFLLAALLHDVGMALDPVEPIPAGLSALSGHITSRTQWFLENLPAAHQLLENSLGARARKRLNQHPDADLLLLLARCDRDGRVPGGEAPELLEALDQLRELAAQ